MNVRLVNCALTACLVKASFKTKHLAYILAPVQPIIIVNVRHHNIWALEGWGVDNRPRKVGSF